MNIETFTYKKKCKSNKRFFNNKKVAWEYCLFQFKEYGQYMTPYKCYFCKMYHMTSKLAQPVQSKWFIKNFNKWFGIDII